MRDKRPRQLFNGQALYPSLVCRRSTPNHTWAQVDEVRCVGCGVCALVCPEGALSLVRRPEDQVLAVPVTEEDWMAERAAARGIELGEVL